MNAMGINVMHLTQAAATSGIIATSNRTTALAFPSIVYSRPQKLSLRLTMVST